MKTRVITAALALLALVSAGADRLLEIPEEMNSAQKVLLARGYVHTCTGWVDPSKPVDSRNAAGISVIDPQRIPLPGGGEAGARRMYEARKANMVMAGTVFVEQLDFKVTDGKTEVLPKAKTQSVTIGQHAGNGVYLTEGNGMAVVTGDPNLAEGATVSGFLLDDGLFEYTTVLGAGRQIAKARLVKPRPATFEEFKAAALAGYPFKTTTIRKFKCATCDGTKVIEPQGQKDKGQKRLCTDCSGQGQKGVTVAAVMAAAPR